MVIYNNTIDYSFRKCYSKDKKSRFEEDENMAIIEVQVDDGTLTEAEKILHLLGMDVQMAVSIYLRRISIEKGLPMNMTGQEPERTGYSIPDDNDESLEEDTKANIRSNCRITVEMVEAVWHAFLRYVGGSGEINPLSTEVYQKTGMSRGSAFIYLNVLSNLVNGTHNTRVLKYKDLEYLMGKIQSDLGETSYQKAIRSLISSVPYWKEKIPGNFAGRVEEYCRKHIKK